MPHFVSGRDAGSLAEAVDRLASSHRPADAYATALRTRPDGALMTEYDNRPEIWGKDPAQRLRYGTAMHDRKGVSMMQP